MAGKNAGRMTGGAKGGRLAPKPPARAGFTPMTPKPQPNNERTATGASAPTPPLPALMPGGPMAGTTPLPPPAAAPRKAAPMPKPKPSGKGKATGVMPNFRKGR